MPASVMLPSSIHGTAISCCCRRRCGYGPPTPPGGHRRPVLCDHNTPSSPPRQYHSRSPVCLSPWLSPCPISNTPLPFPASSSLTLQHGQPCCLRCDRGCTGCCARLGCRDVLFHRSPGRTRCCAEHPRVFAMENAGCFPTCGCSRVGDRRRAVGIDARARGSGR